MAVGSTSKVKVSGNCPICLEDMSKLTKVVITDCRHAFHAKCMTMHLGDIKRTKKNCPICRQIPIPMTRAQERLDKPETSPYIECKMLRALRDHDVDYVKTALLEQPQLLEQLYESKTNYIKYPLLTLAVAFGLQELVVFILDKLKKELIDAPNSNGLTALSSACMSGHTQIAKLLINAGAKVNKTNHMGKSALWYAASFGKKELLELLVEAGSSVTSKSKNNCTALLMAVQRGHLEAVNYLISVIPKEELKDHINICSSSITSATALYMAAQAGYSDIVSALISAGADPNLAVTNGQTPLHIAAVRGHLEVVKILVEKGSNVNHQDLHGIPALFGAAEGGHKEICEYLLKANADPDLTGGEALFGITLSAAMVARQNDHLELTAYLENYPR